jgi:hypothetical protein
MKGLVASLTWLVLSEFGHLAPVGQCRLPGRDVVTHARTRGFTFAISRVSTAGTCTKIANDVIYIASATSSEAVECSVRLFVGKKLADSSDISLVQVVNDDDGSILVPVRDSSSSTAGWTTPISADSGVTRQYRVAAVEITTNKECAVWKTVF